MNTTLDFLLNTYGPLLSLDALADVLDRSPQGLRVSLQSSCPLSDTLNASKRKIGRRVYFHTESIAQLIDEEDEKSVFNASTTG